MLWRKCDIKPHKIKEKHKCRIVMKKLKSPVWETKTSLPLQQKVLPTCCDPTQKPVGKSPGEGVEGLEL